MGSEGCSTGLPSTLVVPPFESKGTDNTAQLRVQSAELAEAIDLGQVLPSGWCAIGILCRLALTCAARAV